MFHAPVKGCFFSVKCFKLLFGKNYIKKVGPGINKANLVKELDDLLEKYDTKEDEELEEDDEDCTNLMTSDTEDNSNEVTYYSVPLEFSTKTKSSMEFLTFTVYSLN